jgi:hypothetical protein
MMADTSASASPSPSLAQVVARAAKDKAFFQELLKSSDPVKFVQDKKINLSPEDQKRLVYALKDRRKLDVNSVRVFQLIHGMMDDNEWVECCIGW